MTTTNSPLPASPVSVATNASRRSSRLVALLAPVLLLLAAGPSALARTAGPDAFGYTMTDSTEPGGPTFSWVEISGTGAQVVHSGTQTSSVTAPPDGIGGPVTLGAPFPFYGTNHTQLVPATSGYISTDLGDIGQDWTNDATLPFSPSTGSGARIYVLHDQINLDVPGDSARVQYQYFPVSPHPHSNGGVSIFTWNRVHFFAGSDTATFFWFQALLFNNGDIIYQYFNNPQSGESSTTGIQNNGATIGLLYASNTVGTIPGQHAILIRNVSKVTTAVDELNTPAVLGTGISLREALRDTPTGGIISFDPSLNGQIVNLPSGPFLINSTLTINSDGPAGGLSGGNGLTKTGTGTLTLATNNTYTGATTVSAGTLALQGTDGSPSHTIAGGAVLDLNVAAGTRLYGATTFSGTGTLRKTGAGTAEWGSPAATFALGTGALIDVQGGRFTGGSNANEVWTNNLSDLTVGAGAEFGGVEANVRVDALSGSGTIKSGFNGAGYSNFTFGIDNGSGTFSGILADESTTGNFVKAGTGTQTLTGNNTYSGATTILAGHLEAGSNTALGVADGTAATGTTVANGASLRLPAGVNIGNEAIFLNGAGAGSTGAAWLPTGGTVSLGGPVTCQSTTDIRTNSGTLDLNGPVTITNTSLRLLFGTTNVNAAILGNNTGFDETLSGWAGTINLNAANTYQGSTTLRTGCTLNANVPNALPTVNGRTAVNLFKNGSNPDTLNIGGSPGFPTGASQAIASLLGTDVIERVTLGANILTIGFGTAPSTGGTVGADFPGVISGTGAVVKDQASTQILSGPNTYSGPTTITGGTLVVNETIAGGVSATGTGSITVNSPGTLAGGNTTGTVGSVRGTLIINPFGSVSPGNGGPGILTVNGIAAFNGGSTLRIEIVNATLGSGYDQLLVNGTVTLNSPTLTLSGGFAPPLSAQFIILANDGTDPVTGTFNGLPEGATVTFNGVPMAISYIGGDGNDVSLKPQLEVTDLASLRQAIIDIPAGGLITFAPALNGQTITLDGTEILLNKSLTLSAAALSDGVTISGNNLSRVFNITGAGDVTLDSLTITGGNAAGDEGGGIRVEASSLTARNCTITGNTAADGGALYSDTNLSGQTTTLINSTLTNNTATNLGGAVWNYDGKTVVIHCTITRNTAPLGEGGGIASSGDTNTDTEVSSSIISGNRNSDVDLAVENSSDGFTSAGYNLIGSGDALASFNEGSDQTGITNPKLAPLSDYGGPTQTMPPLAGSPAINKGGPTGLTTDQRGFPRSLDGIDPAGSDPKSDIGAVEAGRVRLVSTTAGSGAGSLPVVLAAATDPGDRILFNLPPSSEILLTSTLAVPADRTVFLDASSLVDVNGLLRSVPNPGGGPPLTPSGVTLRGHRLLNQSGCTAALHSLTLTGSNFGAISNSGSLTLIASTVSGNPGGGFNNFLGKLTLISSTISGNTSGYSPGIFANGGMVLMKNCTVANNEAQAEVGAIRVENGATVLIRHSTITGNLSSTVTGTGGGAGIDLVDGAVTLENTLVADNITGARVGGPNTPSDIAGNITTIGANLVRAHVSGTVTGPAPLTGHAELAPLATNGGATQTVMLLPGSKAIDAGVPTIWTPFTDQRGFTRILAGGLDLGAYEASAGNYDADGLKLFATIDPALTGSGIEFEISADPQFRPVASTLAGTGVIGTADGPGGAAQFNYPSGVTQDADGNVFIADTANHQIRMLGPDGEVSTIAGTGFYGATNGPGEIASFAFPAAVGAAPDGNLYVSDTFNHRIRKLTRPAIPGLPWSVSTFAGDGVAGYANSGSGAVPRFSHPHGLAIDELGNVFVADTGNNRIRLVTPGGVVSTYAGNGLYDFSNNANPLAGAFRAPTGLAYASGPKLFIADRDNNRIRVVDGNGLSTLAGSGTAGATDATGLAARFNSPAAVAIDLEGNLYVADEANHKIRKVTVPGGVVTTLAGLGASSSGSGNGNSDVATFNGPTGLVIDRVNSVGNLIVTDARNSLVRHIAIEPITVPGTGGADAMALLDADALGLTPGTTYYVRWRSLFDDSTQTLGQSFVLVEPPTVTTLAAATPTSTTAQLNASVNPNNSSTEVTFEYSTDPNLNGSLRVSTLPASLTAPRGVATNANGDIFVANAAEDNHWVQRFDSAGSLIATFGDGPAGYLDEVNVALATFDHPAGLAVDGTTIYVADEFNHCIRSIDLITGTVDTFAGSGIAGFEDGPGTSARFLYPHGLAIDPATGTLYVADAGNHRIRKITSAGEVSTLAGSGESGFADGTSGAARFNNPMGVAFSGNAVYVADTDNHRIRRFTPAGNVTTFAGSGTAGFLDGEGALARFASPTDLASGAGGVLHVTDRDNHRIRRLDAGGAVTTIAGSGRAGSDDTPPGKLYPATAAGFDRPVGIASAADGTLVVTEEGNQSLRKIARDAGPLSLPFPAVLAGTTEQPANVAIADLMPGGTYYFRATGINGRNALIEGEILSFVTPQSEIVVHAGDSTAAPLLNPGETIDFGTTPFSPSSAERSFTIENIGDFELRISSVAIAAPASGGFSLSGNTSNVLVPAGESRTFAVTLASGSAASFLDQIVITSDDQDEGTISFSVNGTVLAPPMLTNVEHEDVTADGVTFKATVTPQGSATDLSFEFSRFEDFEGTLEVLTKAGSDQGFSNGCGPGAKFNAPGDVAADRFGNVYVADTGNNRIRKITPDGDCIVLAGSGVAGFADGSGLGAQFNAPVGLAVDLFGNVFVADTLNHRIRKITPAGAVTTVAGTGEASFTDGIVSAARFNRPTGIDVDAAGVLYVADSLNGRVRVISGGEVSTKYQTSASADDVAVGPTGIVFVVAYNSSSNSSVVDRILPDGNVESNIAGHPANQRLLGIAVDASNQVYLTSRDNHDITQTDGNITTGVNAPVAGLNGSPGADDGGISTARFNAPAGITISPSGVIFIADQGNHRIRQIALASRVVVAATGLTGTGLDGTGPHDVEVEIAGLDPNTEYFYRAIGTNGGGTVYSPTIAPYPSFTTLNNVATLAALTVNGAPVPGFDPCVYSYAVPPAPGSAATLTATASSDDATIRIYENGIFLKEIQSGISTVLEDLKAGANLFQVEVISEDGTASRTYRVNIIIQAAPFVAWQNANFGSDAGDPAIAGPNADPSHDLIDNLQKYALGLDPNLNSVAGLPVPGTGPGVLTLTYTRVLAATDLTYAVECSTTLQSWSAVGVTEQILSDDGITQRIRASVSASGETRKFLRLNLTLQP